MYVIEQQVKFFAVVICIKNIQVCQFFQNALVPCTSPKLHYFITATRTSFCWPDWRWRSCRRGQRDSLPTSPRPRHSWLNWSQTSPTCPFHMSKQYATSRSWCYRSSAPRQNSKSSCIVNTSNSTVFAKFIYHPIPEKRSFCTLSFSCSATNRYILLSLAPGLSELTGGTWSGPVS